MGIVATTRRPVHKSVTTFEVYLSCEIIRGLYVYIILPFDNYLSFILIPQYRKAVAELESERGVYLEVTLLLQIKCDLR